MQQSSNANFNQQPNLDFPPLTKTRNIIGGTFDVTEKYWTVSLMRDNNSKNPMHTFLIIEGIQQSRHVLKLADLVVDDSKPVTAIAMSGKAAIRLKDLNIKAVKARTEGYVQQTWQITSDQGQQLLTDVANDIGKDITYNNFGNSKAYSGLFGMQATDNCLTWAEGKLKGIGLEVNKQFIDIIVAIPTWHIPETNDLTPGDDRSSGKCLMM